MLELNVETTSKEFKKGWKAAKKHNGYKIKELEAKVETHEMIMDYIKEACTECLNQSDFRIATIYSDILHQAKELTQPKE